LFALLRVLPSLAYPLGNNQGRYAVIGRDLLQGQQLYPPSSWWTGDCIYVWGAHSLPYYLTESCIPTRFVVNFPLMSPWAPPAWRGELVRDLERSRPAFLVVARNDVLRSVTLTPLDSEKYLALFPRLSAYIAGFYTPVETLPDFVIYRRTASSEAGEAPP
jgi:hypothetical protein